MSKITETREAQQIPRIFTPADIKTALTELDRASRLPINKLLPIEKEIREQYDHYLFQFLEFRAQVLSFGGELADARVDMEMFVDKRYQADQCPNETITPVSTNRLFVVINDENGNQNMSFQSRLHSLARAGGTQDPQDLLERVIKKPDRYRADTAENYLRRIASETLQINDLIANTRFIEQHEEREVEKRRLQAIRGRYGESALRLLADPHVHMTARIDVDTNNLVRNGDNIWITLGNQKPFNIKTHDQGPGGIPMRDLISIAKPAVYVFSGARYRSGILVDQSQAVRIHIVSPE